MDSSTFREAVFQIHTQGRQRGHYFLTAEDDRLVDRTLHVAGRRLLSFGSCSYLGLEFDPRLIEGGVDAYRRYGSQTSFSRGYLSTRLYPRLENELLPAIFGVERTLLLPSTSTAHHVVMPALIDERDAVVIDHQVHRSVDDAVTLQCARSNAKKLVLRHGELDRALETVERLSRIHRRVWFMCDGIYSMYGDHLPGSFLRAVLACGPNVRLYVDDAHGMSWAGEHGRGHFLSRFALDERTVVVTSLAKAFGTGGGVVIARDPAIIELARLVGGPFSFSGPLRPGDLGASIASAELHLSGEITGLQARLRDRVALANALCRRLDVPLLIENDAPIFFIALGRAEAVFSMAERLYDEGFHVNVSGFPAVPANRGGLRIAINAVHEEHEITALFTAIAEHLPQVLAAVGVSRAEIGEQFEGALPPFLRGSTSPLGAGGPALGSVEPRVELTLRTADGIDELDPARWDGLLGDTAYIDAATMRAVEQVFNPTVQVRPEYHWEYRYLFVDDDQGVAAATVLTTSIIKDDVFMTADVSAALERQRVDDPYLFTSRSLSSGTMASEGLHVYLRPGPGRDAALVRLLEAAEVEMRARGCRMLVLGDFPDPQELGQVFTLHGFVPMRLLDNHVIELAWTNEADFITGLTHKKKRNSVRALQRQSPRFRLEIWGSQRATTDAEIEHLHRLYMALARKNLSINIFPLPVELVRAHLACGSWEFMVLWSTDPGRTEPVAFVASRRIGDEYRSLYVGVDYSGYDIEELSPYRQLLWQTVRRAGALGCRRLHLGMGASREKQRFGSFTVPTYAFVRSDDDYQAAKLQEYVEALARPRV